MTTFRPRDILLPIEGVLRDVQRAKLVLSGETRLSPAEQIRWTAVVKLVLENAERRYYPLKKAAEKFTAAEKAKLTELARDPVRLGGVAPQDRGVTEAAAAVGPAGQFHGLARAKLLPTSQRTRPHKAASRRILH